MAEEPGLREKLPQEQEPSQRTDMSRPIDERIELLLERLADQRIRLMDTISSVKRGRAKE